MTGVLCKVRFLCRFILLFGRFKNCIENLAGFNIVYSMRCIYITALYLKAEIDFTSLFQKAELQ